ncbi:glycoside hydrolase family 1 protein [Dellaglioa sp. L3N]
MEKKVASNFLWGGAVSNVQAEGSTEVYGKGHNVYDDLVVIPEKGQISQGSTNIASNHYRQYKEDLQLFKELGFSAYRIAIVWSRIHPTGEEETPNEAGLAFYDDMINDLLSKGIEPIVSLVHFDMPTHLAEKYNGFLSTEVIDLYSRHVEQVVEHFKDRVKYWITYNEINTAPFDAHSYLVAGAQRPIDMSEVEFFHEITYNTNLASARAINFITDTVEDAKVSGMITVNYAKAKDGDPKNHLAATMYNEFNFYLFADLICKGEYTSFYQNFLSLNGINYLNDDLSEFKSAAKKVTYLPISGYQTRVIEAKTKLDSIEEINELLFHTVTEASEELAANHWGWTIDPIGFRQELDDLYSRYQLPLFIVENGIGLQEGATLEETLNDLDRIDYHKQYIKAMIDAMNVDGVVIMGYLLWSPIDILSSHKEMEKRYGLVYIDEMKNGTMKRIPKKSFYWYKKVIETQGGVVYD